MYKVEPQTYEYNSKGCDMVKGRNTVASDTITRTPSILYLYIPGASGSVTFSNVPPRSINNRPYILRVVGVSTNGLRRVIRRPVRPGEQAHYITLSIILLCDSSYNMDLGNFMCK